MHSACHRFSRGRGGGRGGSSEGSTRRLPGARTCAGRRPGTHESGARPPPSGGRPSPSRGFVSRAVCAALRGYKATAAPESHSSARWSAAFWRVLAGRPGARRMQKRAVCRAVHTPRFGSLRLSSWWFSRYCRAQPKARGLGEPRSGPPWGTSGRRGTTESKVRRGRGGSRRKGSAPPGSLLADGTLSAASLAAHQESEAPCCTGRLFSSWSRSSPRSSASVESRRAQRASRRFSSWASRSSRSSP